MGDPAVAGGDRMERNMNEKTLLYQITETSEFMMSFVIVTKRITRSLLTADVPRICRF